MARKYKKYSSEFKLKVALEAIKEQKPTAQLCQEFGISQSQLFAWKKEFEEKALSIFQKDNAKSLQKEVDKLHRVIGKVTAEKDFLERVLNQSATRNE